MRVTLFRLNKPKRFSIKPRHYDPVMEDLHSRVEMIKSELNKEAPQENSGNTRARIRSAWKTPETRKASNKTSTIRIALIATFLIAFFYLYLFTDFIS